MTIEATRNNVPGLLSDANSSTNASTLISSVFPTQNKSNYRGAGFKIEGDTIPTLER